MKLIFFTLWLVSILGMQCSVAWKGKFHNPVHWKPLLQPLRADTMNYSPSASPGIVDLKNRIILASKGTDNGVNASPSQKEIIEDLVQQLIPMNKVNDIAASFLMNGTWETVYTTNREFSAGKAGPFLGHVQQFVYQDLTLYENHLSLGNDIFHARLRGTWEPITGTSWKIIFKDISLKLFGIPVLTKPFKDAIGIWRTVYLDDNMRIFYAKNANKAEAEENIYVLRKEGSFASII